MAGLCPGRGARRTPSRDRRTFAHTVRRIVRKLAIQEFPAALRPRHPRGRTCRAGPDTDPVARRGAPGRHSEIDGDGQQHDADDSRDEGSLVVVTRRRPSCRGQSPAANGSARPGRSPHRSGRSTPRTAQMAANDPLGIIRHVSQLLRSTQHSPAGVSDHGKQPDGSPRLLRLPSSLDRADTSRPRRPARTTMSSSQSHHQV